MANKHPTFPSYTTDEELNTYKEIMPDLMYRHIERVFKKLWGYPENTIPETDIEGVPFLIESHFTQNIKAIIGVDCPFFGKILYIYFANGFD